MATSSYSPHFLTSMDVKLKGSNYKEWFTTVSIILLGVELLGHVDGTSSHLSEPEASWTLADRRAMTLICQSCEIDVRMETKHFPTAYAMWAHLHHMFKYSSSTRQFAILQDITHVQQRERFVKEYVSDLRSIWLQIDMQML